MNLSDRIIAYITNHHPIPYSRLVQVAAGKGFSEMEVLQALDKVHKSKSIVTKTRKDEIWYDLITIAPPKPPPTHLAWLRHNYPRMTEETDGSGIDIDYSFLFLKTKEERDAYLAEAKGMSVHMLNNKKYAKKI